MAEYQSKYTGKQIDDSVKKSLEVTKIQEKLTPGDNIKIEDNIISVVDITPTNVTYHTAWSSISDTEQLPPKAKTLLQKTYDAITIIDSSPDEEYNYKYFTDNAVVNSSDTWTSEPFSTIVSNAAYVQVKARKKATETKSQSEPGPVTTLAIQAEVQDPPATPELYGEPSKNQIVVKTLDRQQYAIYTGSAPSTYSWQDKGYFSDLSPNKKYYIVTRFIQQDKDEEHETIKKPSGPSTPLEATTAASSAQQHATPEKPTLISRTAYTITISTSVDKEYSIINKYSKNYEWVDGTSTSITFDEDSEGSPLEPDSEYRIVCRVKESEGYLASEISSSLIVITLSTDNFPPEPDVNYIEDTYIMIGDAFTSFVSSQQYKITKIGDSGAEGEEIIAWTNGTYPKNLTPNTEYYMYARYILSDNKFSGQSLPRKFKTKRTTTGQPSLVGSTYNIYLYNDPTNTLAFRDNNCIFNAISSFDVTYYLKDTGEYLTSKGYGEWNDPPTKPSGNKRYKYILDFGSTKKLTQNVSSYDFKYFQPVLENYYYNTKITLVKASGVEYRAGTESTWRTSPTWLWDELEWQSDGSEEYVIFYARKDGVESIKTCRITKDQYFLSQVITLNTAVIVYAPIYGTTQICKRGSTQWTSGQVLNNWVIFYNLDPGTYYTVKFTSMLMPVEERSIEVKTEKTSNNGGQ